MADVSAKLLGQFVDCLENKLLVDDGGSAHASASGRGRRNVVQPPPRRRLLDAAFEGVAASRAVDLAGDEAAAAGVRRVAEAPASATRGSPRRHVRPSVKVVDSPEPSGLDLLEAAGAPVAKRALRGRGPRRWPPSLFIRRRRRRRRSS